LSEINTLNFDDISFSYKNHEKLVLKGLNFQLKKGEKIAIVGETGSGKTTLLNLISSLLYPKSGKIIINKQKELDYSSNIRNNIGYVSQSVYLSDNSILFNITFQNKISSKEMRDLTSVLESLNLNKINNQPINLESPIGERGAKLSGGQIQRVGIARALFRDPSIMILDDATNALDNETEKKILDYIFKKLDNKIIILCTHKKELIKYCDKIIEVKNNEINITSNINNKK
jgi:ATP-binding cassette subfamily C protein